MTCTTATDCVLREMNTYAARMHLLFFESDSKDIYNVPKYLYFK